MAAPFAEPRICSDAAYAIAVRLRCGFTEWGCNSFQKYRVVNNELLYLSEGDEERSVLLTDINFARTRELNEKENPPLDLQSWIDKMNTAKNAPRPPKPPLGDVVQQLGLKGEVDTEGRVFTNDDFPSSPVPPAPSGAAATATPTPNTSAPPSPPANTPSASAVWAASKARIEVFLKKNRELNRTAVCGEDVGTRFGPCAVSAALRMAS